jgi:hypothetical protein
VYSGGEIITARKTSYGDLVESRSCDESEVLRLMETQHRELIREIRNGKFDVHELRPFGHNIVTNRSFDEVVLAFLREQIGLEGLELDIVGWTPLSEGERVSLELLVIEPNTRRPVCGAAVGIRLEVGARPPVALFSGTTDDRGRLRTVCEIPDPSQGCPALVCRAEAGELAAEQRRPVGKPVSLSADGA